MRKPVMFVSGAFAVIMVMVGVYHHIGWFMVAGLASYLVMLGAYFYDGFKGEK